MLRVLFVILFCIAWLGLCWLGMMAVHELGHVLGALITGGSVEQVVLSPLEISRTDVSPNPYPEIVVWLGPMLGSILPIVTWAIVPTRFNVAKGLAQFFAGFCLIANGAYIGLGSIAQIGDCREMLHTGSPIWVLWLFGLITLPSGFWLWHRLGSLEQLRDNDSLASLFAALVTVATLLLVSFALIGIAR